MNTFQNYWQWLLFTFILTYITQAPKLQKQVLMEHISSIMPSRKKPHPPGRRQSFFPGREKVFKQHRSTGCTGQTSQEIRHGWCLCLECVRFFPGTALIHNWLNRPVTTSLRWSAENACLASWPKKLKLRASKLVIRAAIIFRVVEPTSLPPFRPKNVA